MAWSCALELAHADIGGADSLRMPWETGIMAHVFGAAVVGDTADVSLLRVALPELDVVAAVRRQEPKSLPRHTVTAHVLETAGLSHTAAKRPQTT